MDFFEFHKEVKRRPARGGAGQLAPWTVQQLTERIDKALREQLPSTVHVKGEVSNFKLHQGSGHAYFTLKDPGACIDCVMFRGEVERLKFSPEDGMEMLATGRVGVFAMRGRYQLYVTGLEPVGRGALELAYRQLLVQLESEGLFRAERKKAIPPYPRRIALLTSTQTAAVQDMLKVLRRYPWLWIGVFHVPVQGPEAAPRMAGALGLLGKHSAPVDLILMGRGGGSLEDLWAFNEEILARAMARCPIPIVSGIGHEIDTTIADYVADLRTHTPTEAAQVATTHWRTAREDVEGMGSALRRDIRLIVQDGRRRLEEVERHAAFRRPMDRVNLLRQRLDHEQRAMALALSGRLRRMQGQVQGLAGRLERYRPATLLLRMRDRLARGQEELARVAGGKMRGFGERLAGLMGRLRERHPRHRFRLERQRLANLRERLDGAARRMVQLRKQTLEAMAGHLRAIGPQEVLQRGYSITMLRKGGAVLRSAQQVKTGDRLVIRLADGQVDSVVEDARQMRLFEE